MCQWGLDEVLDDCKDCIDNYVDDFIVFSDSIKSYICDLRCVLSRLMATGLMLRGSTYFFGRDTVHHFGFEHTNGGVSPAEEKAQTLLDWPILTTMKEIRFYLGLAKFYRRFIPKFADIAAPLHDLTGHEGTFLWEKRHQEAFGTLKKALILTTQDSRTSSS